MIHDSLGNALKTGSGLPFVTTWAEGVSASTNYELDNGCVLPAAAVEMTRPTRSCRGILLSG
ncbi:MAG: hypothetical protein JW704_07335 [Anaerolineaceae bacterium]|nr:hypothetical protein [Anaerolineaceae bacterium]